MFVLVLNPMRGRMEDQHIVARASTREALIAFLARERVEPYTDVESGYTWRRSFRRDGPLVWYNDLQPSEELEQGAFGHGIVEVMPLAEVLRRTEESWRASIASIPDVDAGPVEEVPGG